MVGAVQKHAAIRGAGSKPEDVNPCPNTEAGNRNSRRVVGVAPLMNSNVIANVMARKF